MTATKMAACVPGASLNGINKLRGSTPRTRQLCDDAISRVYLPFIEQAEMYGAYKAPENASPMMSAALAFSSVHSKLTPIIHENELIVGAFKRAVTGDGYHWVPDGYSFYIDGFAKNAPADRPDLFDMADRGLISPQGSFNHKIVDYAGFIKTGSLEMARRARSIASEKEGDQQDFALAYAIGHEAMIAHAETYAEYCEDLAAGADPARAEELLEIARICRKVPAHPAETFHEAIQSLWFAYMVAGDGVGRIDQYLNDFYQADLTAGRITPEKAQELIECFMIKLHGDIAQGMVNVSAIQTLTLGGVNPDGADASNDLTRLFLAAIRSVRLLRPNIYVRCNDTTPDDLIEYAVEMLGEGISEPSFYGDKPILRGLERIGVPYEDACNYALSGCTEVVLPGKGNWGAPNGWINIALLVDEAIREYAASGGDDIDGLWAAVELKIIEVADACRDCNIWVDEQRRDAAYNTTIMMPVCLDACIDVIHGGAESYYGHWEAIGLPNAADMLYGAKYLMETGRSLKDSLDAIDNGDAYLQDELKRLPKFGNDFNQVDTIAGKLIDDMADALECRRTPLRSALVLGHLAGGENMHIAYGEKMGATLDGRKAGQTLADSLTGSQGQTVNGPTAVINSLSAIDHSKMIAGNVSTIRLTPNDFRTRSDRLRVVQLLKTFFALGGSQIQVNVVDADTLRDAQIHPEDHAGLMIRVAGYSADFTHCGKKLQDEIIERLA
ncbi:MAG: pyruvate formate lyase family protein [Armatimonadota bacterium]